MSIEISNNEIMILLLVIVLIISVSVIVYQNFYMKYVLEIIEKLDKIVCTNDLELKKFKCMRKILKELKNPIKQIRKISNEDEDD